MENSSGKNENFDKIFVLGNFDHHISLIKSTFEHYEIPISGLEKLNRLEENEPKILDFESYCTQEETRLREENDQITNNSILIIIHEKKFEFNTKVFLSQTSRKKTYFCEGNGLLTDEEDTSQIVNFFEEDSNRKLTSEVALRLAIGKIWLVWHTDKYEDFPSKGKFVEDRFTFMAQKSKFYHLNDIFKLQIENSLKNLDFDVICSIGARGFILGSSLAYSFKKGLCLIRKKGKLPGEKIGVEYEIWGEDQEIEICKNLLVEGSRVLIVDDYIESGGTMRAAIKLLEKAGAQVVAIGAFKVRAEKWDIVKNSFENVQTVHVI